MSNLTNTFILILFAIVNMNKVYIKLQEGNNNLKR